jgi:hypothetical protein
MSKSGFVYPEEFYGNYHSQKPICGVLAVALAADVPFNIANDRLRDSMKEVSKERQRFCGPSTCAERDHAMKALGVNFEYIDVKSLGARTMKLKDVVEKLEAGVMYHVVTPKHISTIRDGKLIDQGRKNQPISEVSFRDKRVSKIVKILGRGWGGQLPLDSEDEE